MSTKPRNRRTAPGGQRPAILATSIATLFALWLSPEKARAQSLIIADAGNGSTTGSVSLYDAQTGALVESGLISGLDGAYNLAMAGQDLYISTGSAVYVKNIVTGDASKLLSESGISGMAVSADGSTLYVAVGTNILTYDANNGDKENSTYITGLSNPESVMLSPDGKTLYVANSGGFSSNNTPNGYVSSYTIGTTSGAFKAKSGPLLIGGNQESPFALAIGADGTVYAGTGSDFNADLSGVVTLTSSLQNPNPLLAAPAQGGIVFSVNNLAVSGTNVYVETGNNVQAYDTTTGDVNSGFTPPSGFTQAEGIVVSTVLFINAQGSAIPDAPGKAVVINAAGTGGAVTIAPVVDDIDSLTQASTTASTINTASSTLRLPNGILLKSGAADLTIGTAPNSGSLTAGNAALNVSGVLTLNNEDANSLLTINAVIENNGTGVVSLLVDGDGSTVLLGTNTYTGPTVVTLGASLTIGSNGTAAAIAASSVVTIDLGSRLLLTNLVGNTFANDVTNLLGGTGTLVINSTNTNTLSGTLTDGGAGQLALVQQGTGTTILTNAKNTYTGETLVFNGTLQIGTDTSPGAISAKSQITIAPLGTLALLNVSGNTFVNDLTAASGASGVSTVLLQPKVDTIMSVVGKITDGTGQMTVTQNGPGTSILTNPDNTYTGATTVSDGVLQIGTAASAGAIGFTSKVSIGNGGTLALFNVLSNSFGNAVTNGVGEVGTLEALPAAKTMLTVSGALTDGAGQLALTQFGPGTTILTNASNTYSGTTDVFAGTLQIGIPADPGSIGGNSEVSVTTGSTLSLINVGGNVFSNDVQNAVGGIGTVSVNSTNTTTLSGALTDGAKGQLALVQMGTGTTILTNGGNTYSGPTTVSNGVLQVGVAGTPGSIGARSVVSVGNGAKLSVIDANGALACSISNGLGGVGTLEVDATNTTTLSGALTNGAKGTLTVSQIGMGTTILTNGGNTYSGETLIGDGILQIGTDSASGSIGANSAVSVSNGATFGLVNVKGNVLVNNVSNAVGGIGTLEVASKLQNTISGALTDSGSGQLELVQDDSGTTILTNIGNTYTGATMVQDGLLQVGLTTAAGSIGASSAVSIQGNGILSLVNVHTNEFANNVTNGVSGIGTLEAASANTTTPLTISGTLTDGGASPLALLQNGKGTTILTNAGNTYTGTTDVLGGTLQVGTSTTIGSIGTGDVSVATGGTLLVVNVNGDALANDIENGVGGVGTVVVNSTSTNTLSGTLTDGTDGMLGLTQSGPGTTILTNGGNTYSGATKVTDGVLQVGTASDAGSIGDASPVSVGNGTALLLINVNGSLFANNVGNGGSGVGNLQIDSTDEITLSGNLTGNLALTQSGSGTTILTGNSNTYTGATTIIGGTLQIGTTGDAGSIGPKSAVSIEDGATLAVVNVNGNLLANNISAGTSGTGTLQIDSDNANTLSGVLADGAGGVLALTQSGSGVTILTNAKNTYSGDTTVSGGTLQMGSGTTAGSIGKSSAISVGTGGTLLLVNISGNTLQQDVSNGLGMDGTLEINSLNTNTLSGALTDGSGTLAVTQSGHGTTILTNSGNTYGGATTVSAGILQIGTALAAGSIGSNSAISIGTGGTLALVNFGSNTFASNVTNNMGGTGTLSVAPAATWTLSGNLTDGSGALAFLKGGSGTAILTGVNSYSGATTVTTGALQIGNGSSGNLGAGTIVTVSGTAALVTDLGDMGMFPASVNLNGMTTALNAIQTGTNTLTGAIGGTGAFNQNGTGTTILSVTETYTGATKVNAGTLKVNGTLAAKSTVTVGTAGTLAGTGTGMILGNVILTGNGIINLDSGAQMAGTLSVTGGNWNEGSGSVGKTVTSSSGTFTIGPSGNLTALAGLSLTGGTLAGSGILTGNLTDTSSSSFAFGGIITGSTSAVTMNKAGSTLTLTGADTYGGPTTITAGILLVNGSLGATAVGVSSGGTLGGTGTIGGVVTVNGTLTHAASGPGTITVTGLVLNSGAKENFSLGFPGTAGGTANDLTIDNGILTLGGTINISALFGFGTGTYDLINYTGTLSGPFPKIGTMPAGFTAANFTISTTANANQVDLIVNGGPQVQYWNPNGPGAITGGSGTWDNVTANWTNTSGTPNARWAGAQATAIFSAGSGTVTIADNGTKIINCAAIGFVNGAGSYTLNVSPANTLNISSTGLNNTSGNTQSFVTNVDAVSGKVGTINFTNSATAGSQTQITNNGGTVSATYGGETYFKNTSNAGSAAIIDQGSSVSGSLGGFTEFDNSASAGSATLTNNGGSNGGGGGGTYFTATSDGGTAQAITGGNGLVDISGLTSTGMKIGSISGSGNFFLGSKALTVGGNGMSTTVSGVISDGGFKGGIGGSLTKVGTGTLVLSGANTYTGATTISAGTLEVDGSLAAKSTVAVTTAGTLTGSGSILGNATLTGNGVIGFSTGGNIAGTLAVTGGNWNGVGTVTGAVTSSTGTFTIGNGDNLTAMGGLKLTGGTLAGTGTLSGSLNDTSSSSFTFGGVIAGTGATLTMNHASSTLTLTGANTYAGATTVSAGTVLADNSSGSGTGTGTVTVKSGGKFGGTGTVAGAMTLNSGGIIEPGAGSIGTAGAKLNGNSLIFNGGSTLTLQLGATNVADELILSGALTKGTTGTWTIDLLNAGAPLTATSYTLMTFGSTTFAPSDFKLVDGTGLIGGTLAFSGNSLVVNGIKDPPSQQTQTPGNSGADGTFAANGPNDGSGQPASTLNDPTVANVTPTPEPASALLMAFGGAVVLGWYRRRRSV